MSFTGDNSFLTSFKLSLTALREGSFDLVVKYLRKIVLEYADERSESDHLSRAFILQLLAEFDIWISRGTKGSSDFFFDKLITCLKEVYGEDHAALSDCFMIISVALNDLFHFLIY